MDTIIIKVTTLVIALSLDMLAMAISYGSSKISIPFKSRVVIVGVSTIMFALSMMTGGIIAMIIPQHILFWISFVALSTLGSIKLSGYIANTLIHYSHVNRLSHCQTVYISQLLKDGRIADINCDRYLSLSESLMLALALSLDGVGSGMSIGISSTNHQIFASIACLIASGVSLCLGIAIGKILTRMATVDLSWLSGVILIGIALLK